MMNVLNKLIGNPLLESVGDYTFFIIDPQTGEFTEYYSGTISSIVTFLERDSENSRIADIIRDPSNTSAKVTSKGGTISFIHDGDIFAFVKNK